MVLRPVPASPAPLRCGGRCSWRSVPGAWLTTLIRLRFAADPDVRVFNARLDGRPVGNAIATRTGDGAGVYAVRKRPESRGRRVGTAATWAAANEGTEWGADNSVRQASERGLSLYQSMDVRTVVRYVKFIGGLSQASPA